MAEYIEREAVLSKLREAVKHKGMGAAIAGVLIRYIERIPAADVAPVVHGRWIPFHSEAAGDIQYCSACDVGCTWKPNYCPNCGARMDGE